MKWLHVPATRCLRPLKAVDKLHVGSWDVVTPTTSQEGNTAMEVARQADTARGGAQQVEERVFLTDTAIKLRVALFPEVKIRT